MDVGNSICRRGLTAALCLALGCAPEGAEREESLERLPFPGAARSTLAGETRVARWLEPASAERICLPDDVHPAAVLDLGFGTEQGGGEVRVRRGGREVIHEELAGGWHDASLPTAGLAGACVEVEIEGARVALSRPSIRTPGQRRAWVIFYLVDTLRADQMRGSIDAVPIAPDFARFADASISFERAIGTSSWTRPTVATLFTGLEPNAHRVYGFADRLPEDLPRLPAVLAEAGYHTVALSTNPNIVPDWGFFGGFDRFFDLHVRVGPERLRGFQRLETMASSFVSRKEEAPLFLYVHDNGPHLPYEASDALRELFGAPPPGAPAERPGPSADPQQLQQAVRLYAAAVRAANDRFAALLEVLREAGRYEDAVVVLVGDHGEEFGEHGRTGHGETLFQEQIHVPLAVKVPGGLRRGRVEQGVSTRSVAATVLSLLGIEAPALGARRLPFPGDEHGEATVLVSELDLLDRQVAVAIRWPWKYLGVGDAPGLLFDLEADPAETRDLSGAHPERLAALSEALIGRRRGQNQGFGLMCVAGKRVAKAALRIRFEGAPVGRLEPLGLEDGDRVRTQGDEVVVDFELVPGRGVTAIGPEAMALARSDRDALRAPEFAGSAVRVRTGPGYRGVRVVAGESEVVVFDGSRFSLDTLTLDGAPRPPQTEDLSVCHLWYVPGQADVVPAPVDPEMQERLRELGYVE